MTTASDVRIEYPNPPIEEGLCQLVFAEPLEWSVATPGLLFGNLRGEYPTEPEAQEQFAASVQPAPAEGAASFALNRGPQRYVFRDESQKRLIVANAPSFSVNSLRPYEGWPALRARLERALGGLSEVTPWRDVGQLAIRYINRIVVPATDRAVDTDDYFRVTVRTANEGQASFVGFMHRVESQLDPQTKVLSTFASLESPPGENHFLLDLELTRAGLELKDVDSVLREADELKRLENREFESSITDTARQLFQ